MKKYLMLLILCTAFILNSSYVFSQSDISWTAEELEFIKAHPVVKVGVDPHFVPFEFIDTDNEYKGIAADYIAEISKLTGIRFEIQKGLEWPEAYSKALSREIDVLPAISKTSEREQYFLFSQPYHYFKRAIVTRDSDSEIRGLEDLEGLTVAVQKNSSHHSYLLSKPNINLSLYDSVGRCPYSGCELLGKSLRRKPRHNKLPDKGQCTYKP
jgi:ABC-type amino acid transport substrate-binding protein